MSIVRTLNQALKSLNLYAAWLPVTNDYQVGDYGLITNGAFTRIGNIEKDFNVDVQVVAMDRETKIDFTSGGATMVNMVGSGEVPNLPDSPIDAKIKINFSKKNSCIIKTSLKGERMENSLAKVAAKLRSDGRWKLKYKIISETYTGTNGVIIVSEEKGTEISLEASAEILKQIKGGSVNGSVGVSSSTSSTFHSIGERGVLAMKLFKLRLGDGTKFLNQDGVEEENNYEMITGELENDV